MIETTAVHELPLSFDRGEGEMVINPVAIETSRGLILVDVGLPGAVEQLSVHLDDLHRSGLGPEGDAICELHVHGDAYRLAALDGFFPAVDVGDLVAVGDYHRVGPVDDFGERPDVVAVVVREEHGPHIVPLEPRSSR